MKTKIIQRKIIPFMSCEGCIFQTLIDVSCYDIGIIMDILGFEDCQKTGSIFIRQDSEDV